MKKLGRRYLPVIVLIGFSLILCFVRSDLSEAAIHNVNTSTALKAALAAAVAGDEIVVADGTYTGTFTIGGNSGTASQPITLRAQNRHRALIAGPGYTSNMANNAFIVSRPYWIIDGFDMKDYTIPVVIESGNAEVRHNLIHDFEWHGVWITSGNSEQYIHHNVITKCRCRNNPWGTSSGVFLDQNSSKNTIQHNIIYSITNNSFIVRQGSYKTDGHSIFGHHNNDDNVVQGNLFMDNAKVTGVRMFGQRGTTCSGPSYAKADRNMIRDNIVAFGQGVGMLIGENMTDTQVINNLFYEMQNEAVNAKGNVPGRNVFKHNTFVLKSLAGSGLAFISAECIGDGSPGPNTWSTESTVKDNLFYANYAQPKDITSQDFYFNWNWTGTIKESDYNLFWRPGDPLTWWAHGGPRFSANDVQSASQKPTFVDQATGDFTLAVGSPGKGSASDGTDMGATFNSFLKKQWLANTVALPTQEKNTNGATSISFTADTAHQYQVWAYLPESGYYTGDQTFYVEGQTGGTFNIQQDAIDNWIVGAAPRRYVYLGTYYTDGTLNVSWQHANAASKILIRQMPTPVEAYGWIQGAGQSLPQVLQPPTNLIIVNTP